MRILLAPPDRTTLFAGSPPRTAAIALRLLVGFVLLAFAVGTR